MQKPKQTTPVAIEALYGLIVALPETQIAIQHKSPLLAQNHQSKESET